MAIKYLKQVQEEGLFGVADSLKRELDTIRPLHELIRGLRWDKAVKALEGRGMTQYQIHLILDSRMTRLNNDHRTRQELNYEGDSHWPNHEIEAIKNLRHKLKLIDIDGGGTYWLTENGMKLLEQLRACKGAGEKLVALKLASPAYNMRPTVEEKLDINLGRDGLMTTVSKLVWTWTNGDTIKSYKMAKFVEEFRKGEEEIDNALQMILSSEQRVSRMLIEQGPPAPLKSFWTEEMQRAQNDLYWMSGGTAFWLNPMGATADPTPAPEWWSPPADYQPKIMAQLQRIQDEDVVGKSLLAPPTKGLQGPPGGNRPEWLALFKDTGVVYGLHTQQEVDSFIGARKYSNQGYTVARRDSSAYEELYTAYVTQGEIVPALPEEVGRKYIEKTKEMILDEILAELEEFSNSADDYETYQQKKGVPAPRSKPKVGVKCRRSPSQQGDFFMVEHGNTVRGFPTKEEAEQWLYEQRLESQRKATEAQIKKEHEQRELEHRKTMVQEMESQKRFAEKMMRMKQYR
jgi:hypothetical protein